MTTEIGWHEFYGALFGRRLRDEEILAWQEILDCAFPRQGTAPGWTGAELKAALSAWGESRRKEGLAGRTAEPTAMTIKTLMIRARWKARPVEQEGPPAPPCGLCERSGMLGYYPDLGTRPEDLTLEKTYSAYRTAVPCDCASGEQVIRNSREFSDARANHAARFAAIMRTARQQVIVLNQRAEAAFRLAKQEAHDEEARQDTAGPGLRGEPRRQAPDRGHAVLDRRTACRGAA